MFENSAFRVFFDTRWFVGVITEIKSVARSGFSESALVFSPNPSFKRTPAAPLKLNVGPEGDDMDNHLVVLVQSKIDALQIGVEFDVKTLMGADWATVPSKQAFGQDFKKALRQGILTRAVHVRLDNSPRRDIYRRTGGLDCEVAS